MPRLYIVEQSATETGGHYLAYTGCVADGARQLGLDPIVLANKRWSGTATASGLTILPCFTYSWGEAELYSSPEWDRGNIAYEIFEALRRAPPELTDHIFLHTLGYREFRAMLAWLSRKLAGDPLPYFHILLRRDPDILADNLEQYADYFTQLKASPYLQRKVLLYADTDLLAAAFSDLSGVTVSTAPIPFDQSLLQTALAARPRRRPGDALTIVYLGDAREEKGYQHLPQALAYLWPDYIAKGRVRFILQSNFNTPGGEPGMLTAVQNLAGFPATILKNEALEPSEYFQILAQSDIVLIPYSAQRYRYRSSGVLVEAMSAGKVVVTSAGSWMATQVTPEHAVLFNNPAALGPAIAEAIDNFDQMAPAAAARRAAARANATGLGLVGHLLSRTQVPEPRRRRRQRRVLLVMNGDAMVLSNGASRVAHAQLQYLNAAGYAVVGMFLSYDHSKSAEAFTEWRAALGRSIGAFEFERVLIAGAGSRTGDPDRALVLADASRRVAAPLHADFDYVSGFEFGGEVLQFLRRHPIDAILLNYITNFPVVDALGLDSVPVICEMHDLQSFQRAIYAERAVDADDLDEEIGWLSRSAALISLSARETAIVRERLPDMTIETTGVFLPPARAPLPCLAGAKDLAEIVNNAKPVRPEYQFETAWATGKTEALDRLIEIGFVDLFYVGSAHQANVSGLKWFLSEVYEPYLARHDVSMIVAGSICRVDVWPELPKVCFVDQVEDLAPLYAAARIVVLPITEGAGSPIKTFEALVHGRPIVGTSHAFRGLEGDLAKFIICDDPADFADAVLTLVSSPEARQEAAAAVRRVARRYNDFGRYFAQMDGVLERVLGEAGAATPPPVSAEHGTEHGTDYIEWSAELRALNRLIRSFLDGEALEGWALNLLAADSPATVERMLNGVTSSLLRDRDAVLLRSGRRLGWRAADWRGFDLGESAVHTINLALVERRGLAVRPKSASTGRVVAFGGLPLRVAGSVGEPNGPGSSIVVDREAVAVKPLGDPHRQSASKTVFYADIAALDGTGVGLRVIELDAAAAHRAPFSIAVLQHQVPIAAELRLLGRTMFQGFAVASSAAALAPGAAGVLSLPRIVGEQGSTYVDLLFTRGETGDASIATSPLPGIAITIDARPVTAEFVEGGSQILVRVLLGGPGNSEDLGIVLLTVANQSATSDLCLIGAWSGLLLQPIAPAMQLATVTEFAGARQTGPAERVLAALGRDTIGAIIDSKPPTRLALGVLYALVLSSGGRQRLEMLVAHELSRRSRADAAASDAASLLADIDAMLDSSFAGADGNAAILCPALPFDIVDAAGRKLAAESIAALARRGRSWRVPLPAASSRQQIAIRLSAALEVPGHPGVIDYCGFHPAEGSAGAGIYRWTGPERESTITLPVAVNASARLVIELGATGRNRAADDFALFWNGRPVPHILASDGARASLTAMLEPDGAAGISTEIGLRVRECCTAAPDIRSLGVVFRELTLYLGAADEIAVEDQPARAAAPARAATQRGRRRRQRKGEAGQPAPEPALSTRRPAAARGR